MFEPSEDQREIDGKGTREIEKKMDPRNAQRGPCTFNVVRKELGRFMNEKTPPRNKNPSGFAPVGGTYGGGRE